MIWYFLIQLGVTLLFLGLILLCFKFRKDKLEDLWEFVYSKGKIIGSIYLLLFLAVTFALFTPLKNTVKCSIHGNSMNTETKYSWVMGDCLMKTKNNAWLPININRDQPEGTDHVNLEVTT